MDELGEEDHAQLFDGVDPEVGAGEAAPGELAGGVDHVGRGGIEGDREAEAETDAGERGFAEHRQAHGGEVAALGQVVAGHVLDGLAAEHADAVQFALAEQHVGEAAVVVDGGDHAAAAGQHGGRAGVAANGRVVGEPGGGRTGHAGVTLVARGEAAGAVGRHHEAAVVHAQRAGDVFGDVVVERPPGQHLHQVADHVGGHAVLPACAR